MIWPEQLEIKNTSGSPSTQKKTIKHNWFTLHFIFLCSFETNKPFSQILWIDPTDASARGPAERVWNMEAKLACKTRGDKVTYLSLLSRARRKEADGVIEAAENDWKLWLNWQHGFCRWNLGDLVVPVVQERHGCLSVRRLECRQKKKWANKQLMLKLHRVEYGHTFLLINWSDKI